MNGLHHHECVTSVLFQLNSQLSIQHARSMNFDEAYMYLGNGSNISLLEYQSIFDEYFYNMSKSPDNGDAQYRREMLSYSLMGIGGLIVCSLGIIGNAVSVAVLQRKSMRSSTYSYLSALAVCDMVVLMFTIVLLWKDIAPPKRGVQKWPWVEGIYPHLFPFVHPAAFTFQVTSIWLTLAFTFDRYIMICHPFTAEPFCTISRARKVIAGIFMIGTLFNIPKFFEYRTIPVTLSHNITRIGCDLTAFGRSHLFRELFHSWFYIAFVCAVPFLCLAVLNAFLVHAVHKSRKRGRELNLAEKKRNDTTIMLIGVVVVFFICQTPALVSRAIWAFESNPDAFKGIPLYTLNEVGNFLIILNSSINFVPYYFFGKRFRKEFIKIFCRCILHYKKFQKLSHSFTLTAMEQPRDSNALRKVSSGNLINENDETIKLNCIRKDCYLTVLPNSPHVQNKSESAGSEDSVGTAYEHLSNKNTPDGVDLPQQNGTASVQTEQHYESSV